MNLALTVLNITAPVFILAAVGFVWVKLGFEYRVAFVTRLAMTLSVPCLIFVSDAMPTVGGPDQFDLYGDRIQLESGRIINSDGNLAGAHTTQLQGLQRLVMHMGIDPAAAFRMAVTVPGILSGHDDLIGIVGRSTQDVVILGESLNFKGFLEDAIANQLA